ncbi:MAG TPA: vitamin B12-dependent ribonucleotide reductase, partial [Candidatus Limnocylindria bacterium]|nr:vitamin B12-dependent ribonucleotide reductase [Candidatus Limnocylindria bacterium]
MARTATPTKPANGTTNGATNGHEANGNGKSGNGANGKKASGYRQLAEGQKPTWKGLTIERRFTRPGVHPYDTVEWESREAVITNEHGQAVFEQKDLEIPKSWSQLATQVVASKYFRGHLGTPERERSAKQMIDRVADTITDWGIKDAYFATDEDADAFRNELKDILLKQRAAFNSPVWFNVGIDARPQCSACQPYEALVSTPDGMVPIGQLVESNAVGTEVYDAHGVTRIVAVKNNGRKPVWRIRLANGNFVEATPDHVVKAVRERRTAPEWLRVDQLEVGMRMHLHPHRARVAAAAGVPAGVGAGSGEGSNSWADSGSISADTADPQAEVMRAEAALAGWLQADGFVGQYETGTNRSLTIEFQVANDDEYDWVMSNLDVALPLVHLKVRDADTKTTRVQRIRIYGEVVRDFVERWGLLRRGTDIRVPERLWTASYDEVCAYLRSIFQADGYVSVRRANGQESARVAFAVIGERWSEDVQLLLNSVGIYSRRQRKIEARSDRHDMHEVSISVGSERARFAELIGFVGHDKQARLLESLALRDLKAVPNLREERIVAIDELGVQEVYDIQTESGEYLTNNVAVHNCFINSVEDTMESILTLAKTEGMLFKFGSGAGSNLSTIRSSKETLRGGGEASGPVSFMKGFDAFAGVIKSGGKTRRAAKMVILNSDHPDVEEFIDCKLNEEKKAWALIDAGYDGNFNGGEAYASVFFQNSNNSVRASDAFMEAAEQDADWDLKAVTTGETLATVKARRLLNKMAEAAWVCGDPGIQYDDNINRWHTSANTARINASNPCSEFVFLDDTACNLASLNLMKFVKDDGEFAIEDYKHAVRVVLTAQEILVSNSSYPTPKIEANSHEFRPLGLGYANLGALLMNRGLAYDSDGGRAYAAAITALMQAEAELQSARIARDQGGPFAGYELNREPYMKVMNQHRDAAYRLDEKLVPGDLLDAVLTTWDEVLALGAKTGFRNAQVSVLAPTGTIAFMMDCDTTGVEPDIALIKYKRLVGGGYLKIVNQTVPQALKQLGYDAKQTEEIVAWIDEHETIEGAPHLADEHLAVFDCAFKPANGTRSIHYNGHLKMMAAVQPFISGAISKTVNMPEHSTAEEIAQVYIDGWKLGLKA